MIHTKLTYEEFKQRVRKENEYSEELLQVYEKVYLPLLKKWDGKVYNKRFRTALEQEIKAQGYGKTDEIYVRQESWHDGDVTLVIYHRYHGSLYVRLSIRYSDYNYRISEADSLADERGKNLINNARRDIEERKDAVKNWKKYMRQAEKLQEAINAYNSLPYCFRNIVADYQFHIH
jgi:hypothetical protein